MGRHGENIRKRKDGRWEARYIQNYDKNGKARYRYIYGKSYLEVKEKKQAAHNMTVDSASLEFYFEQLSKKWLSEKKGVIKESTYSIYVNMLEKHLIPDLGTLSMSDITIEYLTNYLKRKHQSGRIDGTGGLSRKTVSDLRSILNQILQFAQIHGFTEIATVKIPSLNSRMPHIKTLSLQEQKKLEKVLFSEKNPFYLGILISLYAGLRIGEVCALQWKDFQFANGTLNVNKTLLRIQDFSENAPSKTKILIDTPKTQCSNRTIPLPDFIVSYFESNQNKADVYLLTGTRKYMEPRTCLGKYKKVLKLAGIEEYNYHALRHTFATRCIEKGFDVKSLSEIMGHSNVSITMQRYVHPSMEMKREQMNRLMTVSVQSQKCGQ